MWWCLVTMGWGADVLPVRRIRFYETGVAWFEREGEVADSAALPIPTSHLDDALKSLVVLGGDVELGAITFPSALGDESARVRAGLGEAMGFEAALRALLGVSVEVTAGPRTLAGVLIDVSGPLEVVRPTEMAEVTSLAPQFALGLLAKDGVLHRVSTDEVSAIRSSEREVNERLAVAARMLAATRAQRPNTLDVAVRRGGRLGLGYLAEAPVWRVSYRILDDGEGEADLQAWALVHNDTDEPWRRVALELANGEPDSFLFPLAAPRYAERELRTPDVELATVSQLTTTTPDEMWSGGGVSYGVGGLGASGYGSGGGSYGAVGHGSVGMVAATLREAEPVQTPTQFVYRVDGRVDLPAHHTALVPLVQGGVPAEAAVVFSPGSTAARDGMWLVNGTQRTLPAGVVSVIQNGGLAGEASLERLKPEESQMLTFSNELDVDLARREEAGDVERASVSWVDDRVQLVSRAHTTHHLDVRNRSGRPRTLWVAMALGPDQAVAGARSEVDRHTGWTWAVVPVEAGSSVHEVRVETVDRESLDPTRVPPETWSSWADEGLADPAVLRAVAKVAGALATADAALADLDAEAARARAELDGVRGVVSDGEGPAARRVVTLEAELRRLAERRQALVRDRESRVAQLVAALEPLGDGVSGVGPLRP